VPARELQAKDVKLIQYLNEAYGKEKQLETALTAHIQMTTRAPYKKRLQQHLKETREHGRQVSRRIKALGGKPETIDVPGPEAVTGAAQAVQNVANRAAALAQGPLHVLRGTGEQEKLLKNAKTQFQDEAEEIATYSAIETLAGLVGDKETAKVAKAIRREEERMRDFLAKLIPQLTKAVAQEEIPAAERRGGGTGRRRAASRRTTPSSRSRRGPTSRSRSGSSRSTSRSGGSRSTSRSTRSRSSRSRRSSK
jgi:ferritin-like metal-binding protein YciE